MKRKVLKIIAGILIVIFLAPILYTTTYYIIEIRPHAGLIAERIKNYDDVYASLSLMENMAVHEEGKMRIVQYTAHSLAIENTEGVFRNLWHLIGLHWHLWLWLLYDDQEQFKLWLSMVPYGKGRGMKEAALHHLNRPLDRVSCYEMAQLVVMVRAPSRFVPGSELSRKRIKKRGTTHVCNS